MVTRRTVIAGGAALATASVVDAAAEPVAWAPFARRDVVSFARALSQRPYIAPDVALPSKLADMDYSVYASLQFQAAKALWRDQGLPFQVQLFPRGYVYRPRIDIFEVADGRARPIAYAADLFSNAALDRASFPPDLGFSGFRLHAAINSADLEEFAVFQGASYFRAVARNEVYGLSARGMALGSGEANEEFPHFRGFWLERPSIDADSLIIHALMDSPSVTGAYSFRITPGVATVFDVEAALYPRVDIFNAGFAPISSMFSLGDIDRYRTLGRQSAVHDSGGLEIWNGRGERLWRPLENPKALETNAYLDTSVRGFGLMQRERLAQAYDDVQQYHRRPSLWIQPLERWGAGALDLVQIPTTDANADNIAAFWRPSQPLRRGTERWVRYRMTWGADGPTESSLARVFGTKRLGSAGRRFQVTFRPPQQDRPPADALEADISAAAGTVDDVSIARSADPTSTDMDLNFNFDPGTASPIELRARLLRQGAPVSETWLYTWAG